MIRLLTVGSLFLGYWSTALASSFTVTIDTEIFIYRSGFEELIERTDTHVECTVEFQRVREDAVRLKIYELHGKWGEESNLLPSSKDLISSFGKAAARYTKKSPLTIVLGKKLSLEDAVSPNEQSFETWNDMLKSVSALADPEARVSTVGVALIAKLPLITSIGTAHCAVGSMHVVPYRTAQSKDEVSSDMRATDLVCWNVATQCITLVSREKKALGRDGLLSWNTVVKYDPVQRVPSSIEEETIYKAVLGRRRARSNIYVRKEFIRLTPKGGRKVSKDTR